MNKLAVSLSALASLVLASPGHAAPINYGDFDDNPPGVVMYTDVTESASAPGPVLGAPTASGNTLNFTPFWRAQDQGGTAQTRFSNVTFNMRIATKHAHSQLLVEMIGDYSLVGPDSAEVMATLQGEIVVQDDLNGPLTVPIRASNSTGFFRNIGTGGAVQNATFSLATTFDIEDLLSRNINGTGALGATRTSVELLIELFAVGGNATLGAIGVTQLNILPTVFLDPNARVSEPAVLAVFCLGLIGLSYAARRRRAG